MGIWDGAAGRLVLKQTNQPVLDTLRVLSRYGLSPLKYARLARDAGARFASIYGLQDAGQAFKGPEEMLKAMGVWELTQTNALEHLKSNLRGLWAPGASHFASELAGAVNRVNYNQNIGTMNALAALVSYLPAADPELFCVAEGNSQLAARTLAKAAAAGHATLRLGTPVREVALVPGSGGLFNLTVSGEVSPVGPFHAVIIATPLEGSNIKLTGLPTPPELPPRSFQLTITTYVTGTINTTTFKGVHPGADVFVTAESPTAWSSIAPKGPCSQQERQERQRRRLLMAPQGPGGRMADGVNEEQQQPEEQNQQQQDSQSAQGQQQQADMPAAGSAGDSHRGGNDDGEECTLFKVFSRAALGPSDLDALFTSPRVVDTAPWHAYPRFAPPEAFARFELAPGLVYANALENAASAMEVSAVSARNAALLVAEHLKKPTAPSLAQ